jgi:hypothetical protein
MRGSGPGERRGGRKKGTPNRATSWREREVKAGGDTPLDYLLSVMRNDRLPRAERTDAAKAAAPYVHPKLATIAPTSDVGAYDLTKLSDEDLETVHRILETAVVPSGEVCKTIRAP